MEQMKQKYEQFMKARQAFDPGAKSWYRMAARDSVAEVFIYDGIGLFGVEAESFINDLNGLDAKEITLRINSPGGNVFDGTAIYNALLRHKAKVSVKIDGLAASMASIIALAGDSIEMAENAFFMIHEPWSLVVGSAEDMRKEAELLEKLAGSAVGIYSRKSNLSESEVKAAMREETWYTAEEAKEAGFIQSIFSGDDEEMRFDLSFFAHAPEGASQPREYQADPRGLEEMLRRDVGMSQKEAKRYIASYNQNREGSAPHRDDGDLMRLKSALDKGINQYATN